MDGKAVIETRIRSVDETPEGWHFVVHLVGGGSMTSHEIEMSRYYYEALNTQEKPEKVIEEAFKFLLERETRDRILPIFNITQITNYFPEFDSHLTKVLQ
jgi:hypothetical protein